MKKSMLFLIVGLWSCSFSFSQGIVFENLSFQEGMNKAKAQNKLLFIDCYTSWCGPCRLLATDVFTQKCVGDFFNAQLVNLKMDMEKGEGPELGKKYGVKAYPTLLLIRGDGTLQHKIVGFHQADELIRMMKEGMNEATSFYNLQQLYESGNRECNVVVRYIDFLLQNQENEKAQSVTGEFMNNLTEDQKKNPILWPIYSSRTLAAWGSPYFTFLLDHKDDFVQSVGEEEIDKTIYEIVTDMFMTMLFKNKGEFTRSFLPEYMEVVRQLDFKAKEVVLAEAEFTQALLNQEEQKTEELFRKYGKQFSNKGIVNLFPILLQTKEKLDKEKNKASWKLIELLETEQATAISNKKEQGE